MALRSRRRFLAERGAYDAERAILNRRAVEWYGQDACTIGTASQLTCSGWIPAEPIPISKVKVEDDPAAEKEDWFVQKLNPLMSRQLPYLKGCGGGSPAGTKPLSLYVDRCFGKQDLPVFSLGSTYRSPWRSSYSVTSTTRWSLSAINRASRGMERRSGHMEEHCARGM